LTSLRAMYCSLILSCVISADEEFAEMANAMLTSALGPEAEVSRHPGFSRDRVNSKRNWDIAEVKRLTRRVHALLEICAAQIDF
jgi:hypothetical protein